MTIACAGVVTFLAFAAFFLLALVVMRVGRLPDPPNPLLVRAETPPYDWEREGL